MTSFRHPSAFAMVAGIAALLAFPLPAAARERDVPQVGPLPAGYAPGDVRDDVIPAEAPLVRVSRSTTHARTLSTADGYQIEVEVSSAYPDDPAADQALVDFLGSRLHGPELGGLRVNVGTPREISRFCGSSQVVACYAVDEARMFVPGEKANGMPVEYPLTHEYGHHVAAARSSKRWNALNWGAKNWARATNVCAHVKGGDLFPGNQGAITSTIRAKDSLTGTRTCTTPKSAGSTTI